MKSWLKRIYYILFYYNKNVKIGKNALLNTKNRFEGYNVIGKNSEISSCKIGLGTYISNNSIIRKAIIGKFCSIGSNVQISLGLHPSDTFVSTHPAFFSTLKPAGFTFANKGIFDEHIYIDDHKKYTVEIGNDVWIGNNAIIMDGLKIGDGAIIAAGAVVTKNVLPYAIIGGMPAKLIRFRFSETQIKRLLDIKWWDWDFKKIESNSVSFNNIEPFINSIK